MRLGLCLLSAVTICAHAAVISFDDLTGQACYPLNITTCGPNVTDQYASLGVTFENPSSGGQDVVDTLLTPFIPSAAGPNVLFVYQGGGSPNQPQDTPFQILFSVPVTTIGFDYGSSTNSFLELDVYGSANTLLETVDFEGSPAPIGLAGIAGVQGSTPITRVDVSYHPDFDPGLSYNFSIDNLEFGSTVPEPSTLAMAAAGFLGIALGRRSRSNDRLR